MIQDLLIPNYEEEYDDIPYDLIYTSNTKIPTRNELTSLNDIVPKDSLCINSFYNNSKYICLFLFLVVVSTTSIIYIIIYTK